MSSLAPVIMLVGPKGSGKTTLGTLLAREPGVFFVEVEAIAQRVLAETGNVIDESYARRAFDAIRAEALRLGSQHRVLILETTGASDETPRFLEGLRQNHELWLVRVNARAQTCATRIELRDPARQVRVPPELIAAMHERTEALQLHWDLVLVNDPPLTPAQVERAFAPLLASLA